MATVYLRYEDPDTGEVIETSRGFHRDELSQAFNEAPPRFQLDAAVTEYAEILRKSYWALEGSMEDVRTMAQGVSTLLEEDPQVTEFVSLVTRAAQLLKEE